MRLEGDDWRAFFDAYERDAFRLETLPAYGVASEDEEYRVWRETGRLDVADDDPWLVRVRNYRMTGRTVGRVHVVTRPLSEYLRFEFAFYRHSSAAGEQIRILDVTDCPDPVSGAQDFWLFDDSEVVLMHYREDGTQIGRELLEGEDPSPYVELKRLALLHSVPFSEYREE
ncbi:DUF6879 family protein [Streptoalloteichus hindustanus]|uniref:DUF6879 domain-containing protein n=1 Tax=Streptoalloteichus hindustanus TaxID=2017 RepID=A0A1M5GFM6_STRHI|nr:DUF6879 family protein [Streptoalloteichus hindustanus]SHG02580.1 hypothetical protein SAMN05444320_106104 [Streptoalloteichus hindustanus]